MKCFNHEDREAVASCQKCGKGLCKECASKYTPCLCDECFARIQQQSAQQAQAAEENRKRKYIASLRACLKSFDKNGGVGDNRKKQAGAGENASIPK